MASESIAEGATAVNEAEQDKTLEQKADILRQNGVDIVQVSDYNRLPTIFFVGDIKEGPRVFNVAIQQGWDIVSISLSWSNYNGTMDDPLWELVFRGEHRCKYQGNLL